MPIWKVSLTDGTYQVADVDGALYPLTTGGEPIRQFNEGWSPRGLQTGLPPLHVLELEHTSGDSTIWLHDETLDYRSNAVLGLSPDDQTRFFAALDPVVRSLYAECVLAPHAAIPAASHQFDGMLRRTIELLINDSVHRTMPASEQVMLDRLEELGAGYGNGPDALSADWIARAATATAASAQERFDLVGHQCQRHLDPATGLVFYVIRADDPASTVVYVPGAKVVFLRGPLTYDPLRRLLTYYAGHTDRVVSLPEALDLAPDLVVPPQHGLDEPPEPDAPPAGAAGHPATTAYDGERTVFEAPLGQTPHAQDTAAFEPTAPEASEAIQSGHGPSGSRSSGFASSGHESELHEPVDHDPDADARLTDTFVPSAPLVADNTRYAARQPVAPAPKQNWWQRLLGLGNP